MDKGKCKGLVGPKGPQAAVRRSLFAGRRSVHRDEMAVFKHKKGLSTMAYAFV